MRHWLNTRQYYVKLNFFLNRKIFAGKLFYCLIWLAKNSNKSTLNKILSISSLSWLLIIISFQVISCYSWFFGSCYSRFFGSCYSGFFGCVWSSSFVVLSIITYFICSQTFWTTCIRGCQFGAWVFLRSLKFANSKFPISGNEQSI